MNPIRKLLSQMDLTYVQRQDFSERTALQRLANNDIYFREKEDNLAPISDDQRKEIESYWRGLMKFHAPYVVNMKYYDVYNKVCTDKSKLKYYVPDSFFYAFIDEMFTNPQRSTGLDDKGLYDLYFADINRPQTIARKVNDAFLDADYNPITIDEFIELCKKEGEVIIKSSIGSWGGHGIKFWNAEKDSLEDLLYCIYDRNVGDYKGSNPYQQYIVQKVIRQDPAMAVYNGSSINTVRVISLFYKGQPYILSSVLRMGIGGSRVDNCSSGGIVCGINDVDGTLKKVAFNAMGDTFYEHPDTGKFAGTHVPAYSAIIDTVKKLAYRFCGVSRMISWDFAVDENRNPCLIEMNISFGEIDFHQLCNGPIFGDKTTEMLKYVIDHNYTLNRVCDKLDKDILFDE